MDADRRVRPHTCVYELSARRLVQHGRAHLDNASARVHAPPAAAQLPGGHRIPRDAASAPRRRRGSQRPTAATRRRYATGRCRTRRPPPSVRAMAPARLRSLFFAALTTFMPVATRRGSPRCARRRRAARRCAGAAGRPLPPYVPAGAYYRAARAAPPACCLRTPCLSATRRSSPCCARRCRCTPPAASSRRTAPSSALRPRGPTRSPSCGYPLYLAGLTHNGSKAALWRRGAVICVGQRVGRRRAAGGVNISGEPGHGDSIEVEQWGGWATAQCPPICGLWANVWRGTGVAHRLSAPFASLSKGTAVAEMVLEVGRRSTRARCALAAALHVDGAARDLAARHPAATSPRASPPPSSRATRARARSAARLVRSCATVDPPRRPPVAHRFLEALLRLSDAADGGGRAAAERFSAAAGVRHLRHRRARARAGGWLGRIRRGARVRARPPVGRARGERQRQRAAPPGGRRL